MGLMEDVLGQLHGTSFGEIAQKVGLTPEQVQSAVAALSRADAEPTETVGTAAAKTGLPQDKIGAVLQAIGGSDGLRQLEGALSQGGGIAGVMSGLFGKS